MFGFGEYFIKWNKIILGSTKGTNFRHLTSIEDIDRGTQFQDICHYGKENSSIITCNKQINTTNNEQLVTQRSPQTSNNIVRTTM